jgi:hypothetical protein
MEVIWHEAIGDDFDFFGEEILSYPPQEKQVILPLEENGLAIVAAIVDVVKAAIEKWGDSAGHDFSKNPEPRFL